MKVKKESEKFGLKLNIQMAFGPSTSRQIDEETVGKVFIKIKNFIFIKIKNFMFIKNKAQTLFFWAPKSLQMVTAAIKLKDAYFLEEKL